MNKGNRLTLILQNGMFSYVGLTPTQVTFVKEKYHVYMLQSARASISGCAYIKYPLQARWLTKF